MKRFLILMAVLLMAASASATLTFSSVTAIDSTHTSLTIEINTADPDSAVRKLTLLLDKTNPPTTHVDSVTSSVTDPDTLIATALNNGLKYYFMVIGEDSVTVDTSAVDSISTVNMTQTTAEVETTTSSFKVETNPSAADSGIKKITLVIGTTVATCTLHVDSVTASITDPDSLSATGLTHNTNYKYLFIVTDSAFADTSDIDSVTTEGISITNTVYDTTYRNFSVGIELANIDSAASKIVIEIWEIGADEAYTRIDSATSIDNDDDSLQAAPAPSDLEDSTSYRFRVIVTDSTGTDTSAIDTVLTSAFTSVYVPLDYTTTITGLGICKNIGNADEYYQISFAYNKSNQSFVSDTIPIYKYDWLGVSCYLFGEENNHTFDSTTVSIWTNYGGIWQELITLIDSDADTGVADWYEILRNTTNAGDSSGGATALLNWGSEILVKIDVSDSSAAVGDTMLLDTRKAFGEVNLK